MLYTDVLSRYDSLLLGGIFPHVPLLCGYGDGYFDLDVRGSGYREVVLGVHGELSRVYVDFLIGVSRILYGYGFSLGVLGRFLCIYSSQADNSRVDASLRSVSGVLHGIRFPWYDGMAVSLVDFGGLRLDRVRYADFGICCYLFGLWGLGWFLRFPLSSGYLVRRGTPVLGFDDMVLDMYSRLPVDLQVVVRELSDSFDDVISLFSRRSVLKVPERSSIPEVDIDVDVDVDVDGDDGDVSERVNLMISDMSKWTGEDFWREMTELYVMVKDKKDVRNMMRILELKAKELGILEDKSSNINNVLVLIGERARHALDTMGAGIGRREVPELE